ncbi:uncharacterized protein DUF560 [Roseinatronobacter thiooxidans]|uniref:Uncharacterized protein DUF560 n=2 Tax=Roseinatronobacter thiooxidans TaxID=121821 RepID=A0A2W7R6M2_9RHOB|nr:uncharacterized protein DUF560 [Roseinatronobacter thiooxidans]
MRLIAVCLCMALSLFGASHGNAASDTQELSRAQALLLGRSFLAEGRAAPAEAIAAALLRAAPQDGEAQVLMAAALQAQGQYTQARAFARAGHRMGESDQTRFEGAMLAGRSDLQRKAYGRAQFWLRRAAQVAPDDGARELAARNFQQVRRINPLDIAFNLGLRQSSNINNGTSTDVITLLGLPFRVSGDSRALSGLEFSTDLALRYRLDQAARHETSLTLGLATRSYRLSSSARAQAPEARAGDYAFQRFELGLMHVRAPSEGQSRYEIGAAFGRSWYAGRPLGDHVRLTVAQTRVLRPSTVLKLSATGQHQWRRDASRRNATRTGVAAELRHALAGGDRLVVHLGAEHTQAQSIHIRNTATRAGLGYALAQPVLGMRLDTALDLEERRFPAGAFQPDGRRDQTATLGLSAMFETVDYMGFAPVLRLELSNTESNIEIHKRNEANISVQIRSRF